MDRLRLLLRPWERWAFAVLNVVPVPGVGAVLAGWRNAHTTLRRNGLMQATLVVFGSWPLVVPGAIGVGWAVWDAVRIGRAGIRMPPADAPEAAPPKAARR